MSVKGSFFKPWDQIDPTLADGGIADPAMSAEFVGVDVGDNKTTRNMSLRYIFAAIQTAAASIGAHAYSNIEGAPAQALVREILRAIDFVAEKIHVNTRANGGAFSWIHAAPNDDPFRLRPVRFPLRNPLAHQVVFGFLGVSSEVAQANGNALHTNLDPQSSANLLAPLMGLKESIVIEQFGKEVEGHVSVSELAAMFAEVGASFPAFVVPGADEPRPTPTDAADADTGVDLMRWKPEPEDWRRFDKRRATMFTGENVFQPEGADVTDEDVAGEDTVPAP